MFSPSFSRLFTLCSALASVAFVSAAPHQRRAQVPTGPKFVVYTDSLVGPSVLPPLEQIKGFNVINLSFLLSDGPHDQVAAWANLDAGTRQQLHQQYNQAGVSLVVSVFGETELPVTKGLDPTQLAGQMAQFVLSNDVDGIDVDWEETTLVTDPTKSGVGEAWLATFTQTLRQTLPQGQFILSHAPLGPWFQPGFCPGGCYLTVDKTVGSLIDWYNIQFYNDDPSPGYNDCNSLITSAGGSALLEIPKNGPALNKLVIGKPGTAADVTNGGFIDPATLATCVQQAVQAGWNAGVMAFQFPHADTTWITTVKGSSFQ
ncbi:glycoside hydrolase [Dichomitus squalens]|uniref:Glycoside hydrolase n=1 Tax=Dichomitus squalens TaxID=114155 RepID=A0A4Q9MVG8_9APHY|nr:glycoside hydrolase [Dichomitus squalens]